MSANNKKKKKLLSEMQNDMQMDNGLPQEKQEEKVIETVKRVSKTKNVPWYPPNDKIKKELKQLALDEETTMSKLLTEGIGLVFKARGKILK